MISSANLSSKNLAYSGQLALIFVLTWQLYLNCGRFSFLTKSKAQGVPEDFSMSMRICSCGISRQLMSKRYQLPPFLPQPQQCPETASPRWTKMYIRWYSSLLDQTYQSSRQTMASWSESLLSSAQNSSQEGSFSTHPYSPLANSQHSSIFLANICRLLSCSFTLFLICISERIFSSFCPLSSRYFSIYRSKYRTKSKVNFWSFLCICCSSLSNYVRLMYRKRYSGSSRMNICLENVSPFIYTLKLNYSSRAFSSVPKRGFRMMPVKSLTICSYFPIYFQRQYSTLVPQKSCLMRPFSGLKMELYLLISPQSMKDPLWGCGSSFWKYFLLKVKPQLKRSMTMMLISERSFSSPQVNFSPTESTRFCRTSVGSRYFLDVNAIKVKKFFNFASSSYSPLTLFNFVLFSANIQAISCRGSAVSRICLNLCMRKQHWSSELRQQQLEILRRPTGWLGSRSSYREERALNLLDRENRVSYSAGRIWESGVRKELVGRGALEEPAGGLGGDRGGGGGADGGDQSCMASASRMSIFLRRAYS